MEDGGQGFDLPAYGIIPERGGERRDTRSVRDSSGQISSALIRPGHPQVLPCFKDFWDRLAREWAGFGIAAAGSSSPVSDWPLIAPPPQ
jgi:hypothetical protein